jgi:chromosome partitioning protein
MAEYMYVRTHALKGVIMVKHKKARVWIFFIRKGGSAKTTSAVNFAAALAYKLKRKVLVIDLDPQANATSHMGINPRNLTKSVNTLFTTIGVDPHEVIIPIEFSIRGKGTKISIMPAARDLDETDLSMKATQVGMFKPIIEALQDDYDDIVIDTRPTRSMLTISALVPATHGIIPMEAGVFALDALEDSLDDYTNVKKGLNPDLKLVGILPTRVIETTNLSGDVLGSATQRYDQYFIRYSDTKDGEPTLRTLYIRNSIKMGEAPAYGIPGIAHEPNNPASQDYMRLAEVLHAKG